MTELLPPDWDAPLAVDDYVRATPKGAKIKGLFVEAVAEACRAKGLPLATARERYLAFNDYPLVEHLRVLADGAAALFPDRSLRRGLRSIGRSAYSTLVQSTFGKVVFGGGAVEMRPSIDAILRAYAVTMPSGKIDIIDSTPSSVTLRMTAIYTFLDSHHVGIFEGLAYACGVHAEVRVRLASLVAGDVRVTW